MPIKFIALHRTPPSAAPRSPAAALAARAALVESVHDAPTANRLADLGLTCLEPAAAVAAEENLFWPLCYLDAYVVETTDPQLARLARDLLEPDYLITPNIEMTLPLPGRGRIFRRLPTVREEWPAVSGVPAAHAAGLTGHGVRVCVLDTGVDADHMEMRDKVIDFRYVPLNPSSGTLRDVRGFDVDGHGTHVSGIVAGKNIGVAPDVELMVAAVLESETLKTTLERVVVALNWVLSQFQHPENLEKPVIVNLSLGFTRASLGDQLYTAAVTGLHHVLDRLMNDFNVLPIVAVGNDGDGAVRAPAYFAGTLSVGAVDFALQPADFSGGGTSPETGESEPNLAGYGVDVLSCLERTRHNRSIYQRLSGTSMAAPYVTGIAALYAAQNPQWQGKALAQRLIQTALPITAAPAARAGAGLARFVQEATT